jgi:thiosulfate dehydrogenase (quinone) large subunit
MGIIVSVQFGCGKDRWIMSYLRNVWQTKSAALWLALLRIATGYVFIHAGWEKVSNPEFVPGMAKTLGYFMSQNPYPWMASLLKNVAIPNATIFGYLFAYGELLVVLSLFFGLFSQIGLLGAFAMNVTFYFAAGWTGASTATANEIMAIANLIMLLAVAGKVLSVDELIARLAPRLVPWMRKRELTSQAA